MDRLSLEGKVAIVTGSSSGIGEAIATLFLQRGAKVVIHGRNTEKLNKVKDKLEKLVNKTGQLATAIGDVREESVRKNLVDAAINTFGKLDILVNNAGFTHLSFIRDVTESQIDDMYSTFLKAPVLMSQQALPHLIRTKGNIVNISSGFSLEVGQQFFPFAVSVAAQDNFTRYAAVEYGHAGVRVNSIRPGIIHTPGFDSIPQPQRDHILAALAECAVLGRNGQPDDIAQSVAYLASDAASFVTGVFLDVDGGRAVYRDRSQKGEEPKYDDLAGQKL